MSNECPDDTQTLRDAADLVLVNLVRWIEFDVPSEAEEARNIVTAALASARAEGRAEERARWAGHVEQWLRILPKPKDADHYDRGCAQTLANLLSDMAAVSAGVAPKEKGAPHDE